MFGVGDSWTEIWGNLRKPVDTTRMLMSGNRCLVNHA
jgi:hypothetical protein